MKEGDIINKIEDNSEKCIKLVNIKNPIVVSKRISKVIVKIGNGDKTPRFEDKIVIKLVGMIINADDEIVFDELRTIEFKIGEEEAPLPIEKVARSMKEGEIAIVNFDRSLISIISQSDYQIPENGDVIYRFELINIDPVKSPWDCKSFQEYYDEALLRREEGSKYFKVNKLTLAATKYKKALLFLECYEHEETKNDDEIKMINKLKSSIESNLAAVALLNQEYEAALIHSNNAIDNDSENLKAYYRRGQYYLEKKMWNEAEQDFLKILEVEPNNYSVKNALLKAKKGMNSDIQKEKLLYRKMAQKLKSQPLYSDKIDEKENWLSNSKYLMIFTAAILIILILILLVYFIKL